MDLNKKHSNNSFHLTLNPSPKREGLWILGLVLVTFFVYFNSLPNEFIFDDKPLVENSINVLNASFWDLIFSYRPLRYISYALDYRFFGMNPWGFRLMNIVYHALTVVSLFWMLKVFGLSKRASFLAALIFAIHPVNTDAVAYISGRRDILMGLFYILSVGWFIRFYNYDPHPTSGRPLPINKERFETTPSPFLKGEGRDEGFSVSLKKRFLYLTISILFMFLSISSKEMGATIPLIFILYVFYKDGSKFLEKRWFYLTVMSFFLLFLFFTFGAISSGGSGLVSFDGVQFHGNSPEVHYLTAATIFLHYIKLTVFPLKLILDNANYHLIRDWNYHVLLSFTVMFGYAWVVWRLATQSQLTPAPSLSKREGNNTSPLSFSERERGWGIGLKQIAFFLVFFVITLAPVLQIIPLHEIVAVHYLYVPVIGFCAIVGIMVDKNLLNPHPTSGRPLPINKERCFSLLLLYLREKVGMRVVGFILLIFLIAFFSIRTITRNFELKDHWTVFHNDESWGPLSFRGYFTLGAEYMNMKFPDKAAEYYEKAQQTGYWDGNLLGNIIGYNIVKGNHAVAFAFYEEMERKQEFVSQNGVLNMAVLYMINGKCDKAVQLAVSFTPDATKLKRIEIVKKCKEYEFDKYDDTKIEDIHNKQQLMKSLGLEAERKPYLKMLIEINSTTDPHPDLLPAKEKVGGGPSFDKRGEVEDRGEFFSSEELIELINELAVVNLQSDIPEAVKYYKMEQDLYKKLSRDVPEIVEKSIKVLEDYQYKVLVEGKYYKLDW